MVERLGLDEMCPPNSVSARALTPRPFVHCFMFVFGSPQPFHRHDYYYMFSFPSYLLQFVFILHPSCYVYIYRFYASHMYHIQHTHAQIHIPYTTSTVMSTPAHCIRFENHFFVGRQIHFLFLRSPHSLPRLLLLLVIGRDQRRIVNKCIKKYTFIMQSINVCINH